MMKKKQEKHFLRKTKISKIFNIISFFSSKILYTWQFILNSKSHKIQFWDSKLSGKKKLVLDSSVLMYDKNDSAFFCYKFSLEKHKFEIAQIDDERYELRIDGRRFKRLMTDERNGVLDKAREERIAKENEQKEIDEYNKRAMQYNGSNYYEGMEYKIMEKERQRERERERERERQREREREWDRDNEPDDFLMIMK